MTTGSWTEPTTPAAPSLRVDRRQAPARGADEGAPTERGVDEHWLGQERWALWGYWAIHAACLLALWTGVSLLDAALCATLVFTRMFGITGGYHRYFAHRTYKTGRVMQFALAWLGCSALQKGPLWWAAGHRRHHRYADREGDMHSPNDGFWHSHQGWIFNGAWDRTENERIRDFEKFPELRWLNRNHLVPPLSVAALCTLLGGFSGLVWGFFVSTVLLWHLTYTINSLAHVWGTRRYDTPDTSRNNWLLALLTLGEGWHNNHHHYQSATRNGFLWWEIDVTYYALRALAAVGLVWDLREPPAHVVRPPAS